MAFYNKPDPVVTAEKALAKLNGLLSDAEAARDIATSNASRLALDGADDATLGTAETKVRDCTALVNRRQDAVVQKQAEIAALKVSRDTALDHKQRTETANEIETKLASFGDVGKELNAVMIKLTALSEWANFIPESQVSLNYSKASAVEIPANIAMLDKLIREHAAAVLRGDAPASLRKLDAPPNVTPVAVAPLTQVFSWYALTWLDQHNQQRIIAKWRDVELPPVAAAYALEVGLALPPTDPRCNGVRNRSPGHPEPGWLNDLDKKTGPNIPAAQDAIANAPRNKPYIIVKEVASR